MQYIFNATESRIYVTSTCSGLLKNLIVLLLMVYVFVMLINLFPSHPISLHFWHALVQTFDLPESVNITRGKNNIVRKERRIYAYVRRLKQHNSPARRTQATEKESEYVKHCLRSTIDNINLDSVVVYRNWNPRLYCKYMKIRKSLINCNTTLNEKIMFRGTNRTSTDYTANNGYTAPAVSCFGEGFYFAMDANYAAMYAHIKKETNEEELTLALIITGKSDSDGPLPEDTNPAQFHSVMRKKSCSTDFSKESICCAIKDQNQSYPLYLIRYKTVA